MKAISKEQIDALHKAVHYPYNKLVVDWEELQALYDNAPSVAKLEAKLDKLLQAVEELLFESQEYHFDDGLGQGALQLYWDKLQNAYDETIGEVHLYD